MAKRSTSEAKTIELLTELAARPGDVEKGVACKGTSLESTTFGIGKKVFLFMRIADGVFYLRLKLSESLPEATRLASKAPTHYSVGSQGWAKLIFGAADAPRADLLERWIDESRGIAMPQPKAKRKSAAKRRSPG